MIAVMIAQPEVHSSPDATAKTADQTAGSHGVGDDQTGGRPGQPGQQVPGNTAQHRLRAGRSPGPGRQSPASFSGKFEGQLAETEIDFRRVLLLKPETFMNLEWPLGRPGSAVFQAAGDRPPGRVR